MPYTSKTTASELVSELAADIKGKTILVTGPSPGSIGAVFAEAVAQAGPALVILAGRNPAKIQPVADNIKKTKPEVQVRILTLNLGSLADVRKAASEVNSWDDVPTIDVLLNNAGIMAVNYALSPDGIESQFATNHAGHFLFTNLIIKKILAAKSPRIVNVSSNGHHLSPIRFYDYNFDNGKTYNRWIAYGQSKTANILMALSLSKKLGSKTNLLALSLHPGVIMTNLANHLDFEADFAELRQVQQARGIKEGWSEFELQTPDQGAATSVYVAFHPELKEHNGAYLLNCGVADPWGDALAPWATSPIEAEKLWKLSERLVGQEFSY